MMAWRLIWRSLANRRATALLTVLAVAASVALLLVVEKMRTGAHESFADTISGTDLIMGARAGDVQLLLYSVFRIGNATANVTWQSYQDIAARPEVAWIVPISLGDSHRGFRVLGTENGYFEHYRYRRGQQLQFAAGGPLGDLFDAVLGAEVAERLGYRVGDAIVVSHGMGEVSFADHADKPFRVAGILTRTGTPVDRTVHVSLEAIEAIHVDWQGGARVPGAGVAAEEARGMDLEPKAVTAALIGMKSRLQSFQLQRYINEYREEALAAVLPGVALQQLWGIVGVAETALTAVAAMVVVTALLGMATMVLATLNERRREMAILRSVGATPATIMGLLLGEAALLVTAGAALGVIATYATLAVLQPLIDKRYGLYLEIGPPTGGDLLALAIILVGGVLAGLLPAWRAYRLSLADGMTVRT
ncbi:MAG: ABC transporter permease [Geminicoccaceae bacterium]